MIRCCACHTFIDERNFWSHFHSDYEFFEWGQKD